MEFTAFVTWGAESAGAVPPVTGAFAPPYPAGALSVPGAALNALVSRIASPSGSLAVERCGVRRGDGFGEALDPGRGGTEVLEPVMEQVRSEKRRVGKEWVSTCR